MKISVAVRTKFHAFHLAHQLHQQGHLHQLYTSYYGNFLGKKNNNGIQIPSEKIVENYWTAFFYYGLRQESIAVNEWFAKQVAARLGEEDLVAAWSLIAKNIFEKATQRHIKKVLVHPSAHAEFHYRILLEEYQALNISTDKLQQSFSDQRMQLAQAEYESADYIQVPSAFVANTFLAKGWQPQQLITAPLGVDMQVFQRTPHTPYPSQLQLVYAGGISVRKGIIPLLKVLKNLNLPRLKLRLIGNIDEEIKEQLGNYRDYFEHFRAIPQNLLKEYLQQSSVFVINSLEDGFAQVVPQAMACGLPVICTHNVGAADCVQDGVNGFIVPTHAPLALAEKIVFFYENPHKVAAMGQAAYEAVKEQFSWQIFGHQIIKAYQTILGKK